MATRFSGGRIRFMIEGDDDSLTRAVRSSERTLGRLDGSTKRYSTTQSRAARSTSMLDRATGSLGSRLRSAAGYAAGAAAAYVSISQAKAAITTTQELAKATLGLEANLGLSGRTAGEWAAAANVRGVETTKLTMAFRALSTQVEAARDGSDTAKQMFDELGVSMDDVESGATNVQGLMLKIADGMDEAGAGTDRTANAAKLFGRSWSSLAPLIRDGSDALRENLQETEKYGAALHGGALEDQAALRSSMIESKTAILGMKVTFASALAPTLTDVSDKFQRLAAIMADDKLSRAEKLEKIGDIIGRWGEDALDAFTEILPELADHAGEAAPKVAGAFVDGFINSGPIGKLALGGWLLSRLGGGGIGGLGSAAGTKYGGGFAASAGPLISATVTSAIAGVGFAESDTGKAFLQQGTSSAEFFAKELGIAREEAEGLVRFMERNPGLGMTDALDQLRDKQESIRSAGRTGFGFAEAITKDRRVTGKEVKNLLQLLGKLPPGARKEAAEMVVGMAREMERKGKLPEGAAKRLRDAVVGQNKDMNLKSVAESSKMVRDQARNFQALLEATSVGFDWLGARTNKALKAFGVQQVSFALQGVEGIPAIAGSLAGAGAAALGQARGGITRVSGSGRADSVPLVLGGGLAAAVAPGEDVIVANNKQRPQLDYAVALAYGDRGLAGFFARNDKPHGYEKGGVVGGDTGGLHPTILNFVSSLYNQFGGTVTSGLRPGSLHGTGQAADYVPSDWAGAAAAVNRAGPSLLEGIYNAAQGGPQVSWDTGQQVPPSFWGTGTWADHWDHIHVAIADGANVASAAAVREIRRIMLSGPDGPMTELGQAALDKVRSAANKFIASKRPVVSGEAGRGVDVAGVSTGPGALSRPEMRELLKAYDLPDIMGWVAGAETNWTPSTVNSIGATGLFQILVSAHPDLNAKYDLLDASENTAAAATLYRANGLSDWEASRNEGGLPGNGGWGQYMGQPFRRGGIVAELAKYARGGLIGLIGDSLTVGEGGFPDGWKVNAKTGRHTAEGLEVLKAMLGDEFGAYVFDLGTNDGDAGVVRSAFERARDLVGDRGLAVSSFFGPKANALNDAVRAFDGKDAVADWHDLAAANPQYIAGDGIHATSAGYAQRKLLVRAAGRKALEKATDEGGPSDTTTSASPGAGGGTGIVGQISDTQKEIEAIKERLNGKGVKGEERKQLEKKLERLEKRLEKQRERLAKKRERRAHQIANAGLHPELAEKLRGADEKILEYSERIDIADRNASLPRSEAAEEYGAGELSQILGLYGDGEAVGELDWHITRRNLAKRQVDVATDRLDVIEALIADKKTPKWQRQALRQNRTNAKALRRSAIGVVRQEQGVTGEGGFIFDTQDEINQLIGRAAGQTSETGVDESVLAGLLQEQLDEQRRENALLRAQYQSFYQMFGQAPTLHDGGIYRAPTPGGEGYALLKDQERVLKAGDSAGAVSVQNFVTVDPVSLDARVETLVNGVLYRETKKAASNLPTPGAKAGVR